MALEITRDVLAVVAAARQAQACEPAGF